MAPSDNKHLRAMIESRPQPGRGGAQTYIFPIVVKECRANGKEDSRRYRKLFGDRCFTS